MSTKITIHVGKHIKEIIVNDSKQRVCEQIECLEVDVLNLLESIHVANMANMMDMHTNEPVVFSGDLGGGIEYYIKVEHIPCY